MIILQKGDRIGTYTIAKIVNSGAMGVIYEIDGYSDRVLKMPKSAEYIERAKREIAALEKVRGSPYIVEIKYSGSHTISSPTGVPQDYPYFLMEKIKSEFSLKDILEIPFSIKNVLVFFGHILEGAAYMHSKQVWHRDITPANIMIRQENDLPVIIDFGLANAPAWDPKTIGTIGTLEYMAPEQVKGTLPYEASTDVYALGTIFYKLLTGRHPFQDSLNRGEPLQKIIPDELPRNPKEYNSEIPEEIATVCIQCLNKDRNNRYYDAQILKNTLDRFIPTKISEKFEISRQQPCHGNIPGFRFICNINYPIVQPSKFSWLPGWLLQWLNIAPQKISTVSEYRHIQTGMDFVLIPGGTFIMGSPSHEKGRGDEEYQHSVTLSSYLIAKTPCTQAQWEQVTTKNPSYFTGINYKHPVENVSWDDCQNFCHQTGLKLPTESQWEYACRAGNSGAYCFGNNAKLLDQYAWYYDNAQGITHPVNQKNPNAFDLYDMHGNVWEWCQEKVLRGGSCDAIRVNCRCSCRYPCAPNAKNKYTGVRFCYNLEE